MSTKKKTNAKNHPGEFRDQQSLNKAPRDEKGKKDKVTPRDLKGKKVDADPSRKADRPLKLTR